MSLFYHFLFPSESNNYKARVLHPGPLFFVIGFFLLFQFSLHLFALAVPSVLGYASNITPERIVELTNQKRTEKGLPPLMLNPLLSEAARRKAGDMFAFNYWAHNSPSGRDPWSFFKEVGYQYLYAGENLARNFTDPEGVVGAWMASPTHRDNILNSDYQEIGVAVVEGSLEGVQTTLVVQLFGTPVRLTSYLPERGKPALVPKISPHAASVFERLATLPEVVLAKNESDSALISPFSLTKSLSIFFLGFLTGVVLIEAILIRQRRVVRLSGRNLAHTVFLGAMILIILISQPGAIL